MKRRVRRLPVVRPDCTTCGLCCMPTHDEPAFCDVTAEDEARLGTRWTARNVLRPRAFDRLVATVDGATLPDGAIRTTTRRVRAGPFAGFEVVTCVALKGDPMRSVRCSVYERRPDVCREAVKPGDRTCRTLRQAAQRFIDDERT